MLCCNKTSRESSSRADVRAVAMSLSKPINDADNSEGIPSSPKRPRIDRPNKQNRAGIREHFKEVKSKGRVKYAKCLHCPQVQDYEKPIDPKHPGEKGLYKKDGTGNLTIHMTKNHPEKLPPPKLPEGQTLLGLTTVSSPAFVV